MMRNKKNSGVTMKLLGYLITVVTAISFFACIAAIPVAIHYAKSKEGYVAEAQIPAPAEKVYGAAITLAEERAPAVKILNRDDKKLLFEVTDDIQKASFKAEPINPQTTAVIVKADVPKVEGKEKEYEKEQEKELALRIINRVCTKLNVKCTVTNK
jgi:hypothetical protein